MVERSRSSATSLQVKSNSLRPTQSIAGDAFNVSVDKTDFRVGLLRFDRLGHLAIVFQRRRGGVDDDVIEIFRDGETLGEVNVVRRAVEQFGIRRERGGLREPRRIPIAGDFAPRLITRACAAVKTVVRRW